MEPQDDPRFLKGIDEFNQQFFFECHETLEEIWLEEHGEERKFYQGIIQIAAGYLSCSKECRRRDQTLAHRDRKGCALCSGISRRERRCFGHGCARQPRRAGIASTPYD